MIKTPFAIILASLIFIHPSSFSQESKDSEELTADELAKKADQLNLTKYHPIYYAYGNPSTKLQVSFKYKFLVTQPLYFGYSQLMFWYLREKSVPFKDVIFNPEVFYQFTFKNQALESLDLAPYSHTSNGRDGAASRSMNRTFARFNWRIRLKSRDVKLASTFFLFYNLANENKDIYKYVSPLELKFSISQKFPWTVDRGEISFRFFPGGKFAERWDYGGKELGMNFRLGRLGLAPSFYMQYYYGHAESLINYSHRENIFRVGLLL